MTGHLRLVWDAGDACPQPNTCMDVTVWLADDDTFVVTVFNEGHEVRSLSFPDEAAAMQAASALADFLRCDLFMTHHCFKGRCRPETGRRFDEGEPLDEVPF